MMRMTAAFTKYVLLPLAMVATFLVISSGRHGDAEVVTVRPRQPVVSREALKNITPELIEDLGLTIDWGLQEHIASTARRFKVGFGAVAVLDPDTGEILALYGQDSSGEDCGLGLNAYLAASLFKLVTATAAIDYAGMSSSSLCSYTGRAHTLYRSQLFPEQERWSRQITLARAFASSNNVVFGKLGATKLGEEPLLLTAMRLGFWQSPMADSECAPSTLFFPENDFHLAELASGFNRQTRVSPVHAAQMVSAVVSGGVMVKPRILKTSDTTARQVMSCETADDIRVMMLQTVKNGTVSRAFRSARNDRVLQRLTIGAKSGTIKGTSPDGKRNWFMGFAEDPATGKAVAIGCLIIRDNYTRIHSDELARRIIKYHFSRPLEVASSNPGKAGAAHGAAIF